MRRHQVKEMISDGESDTVEFKRKCASPEKIARELIAFANSGGGYLLVGVDDDGRIVGVESEKSEIAVINEACRQYIRPALDPEIHIVHFRGDDVVVVDVAESSLKPHRMVWPDESTEENIYTSVLCARVMLRCRPAKNWPRCLKPRTQIPAR